MNGRKYGQREIDYGPARKYRVSYRRREDRRRETVDLELRAVEPGERVYEAMRALKGIGTRVRVDYDALPMRSQSELMRLLGYEEAA